MSLEVFLSLLLFAFATSITPGPNNMMLLASGVNFGFRRTIPHMLGIGGGFLVLLLAAGLGLGAVLTAFPPLFVALKIAGGSTCCGSPGRSEAREPWARVAAAARGR